MSGALSQPPVANTETNTKRLQVDKPALLAVPTHTDDSSWKDKAFLECISGFYRRKKKKKERGQW